jgi:ABC-type branched-subunit amino acid transport system ATPase component
VNSGVLLEVRDLQLAFGALHVLDGVTLECRAGEVTALIGRNGSGKSTLLNCLSGRLRPSRGAIVLDGLALPNEPAWRRARRGVGWTFQNVSFPMSASLAELLDTFAANPDGPSPATFGELAFEADSFRDQPWSSLSFGQRKLAEILVAASRGPRLLLLDEPIAGLSRHLVSLVGRHLKLLASLGTGILVVEHNREFICETATQAHLLANGRILMSAPPRALLASSIALETLL